MKNTLIEKAKKWHFEHLPLEKDDWTPSERLAEFAAEVLAERDAEIERLVTTLESVEYELSNGDLIAGNVTRFSVKDALLKQVREALGK